MNNEDIDEMERRLVASGWAKKKPDAPVFADLHQRRISEKLIGRDNTDRLARRRPDAARFRPAPVIISYGYWWRDEELSGWQWYIEKTENGRREIVNSGRYVDDFEREIAALRKKGLQVREIKMGFQSDHARNPRPSSARAAIMNQLKDFKI